MLSRAASSSPTLRSGGGPGQIRLRKGKGSWMAPPRSTVDSVLSLHQLHAVGHLGLQKGEVTTMAGFLSEPRDGKHKANVSWSYF